MSIVQYGDWVIESDIEKTKEYYRQYSIGDTSTQVYRNFQKYCETLSAEEKQFFASFGLDPFKCNVRTIGLMDGKRHLPTFGYYAVAGTYLNKPEPVCVPASEFDPDEELPEIRIQTGIFLFDFQDPDSVFCQIPEGFPEGFLCIQFSASYMPWLLRERYRWAPDSPYTWRGRRRMRKELRK